MLLPIQHKLVSYHILVFLTLESYRDHENHKIKNGVKYMRFIVSRLIFTLIIASIQSKQVC